MNDVFIVLRKQAFAHWFTNIAEHCLRQNQKLIRVIWERKTKAGQMSFLTLNSVLTHI